MISINLDNLDAPELVSFLRFAESRANVCSHAGQHQAAAEFTGISLQLHYEAMRRGITIRKSRLSATRSHPANKS